MASPSPWVRPPPEEIGRLQPVGWEQLPGWHRDELVEAWPAFIRSCMALKSQARWQAPCWAAAQMNQHDDASLRKFFESWFKPYRVVNADGSQTGLVTGYYEPLLRGSRTRTQKYRYPLYSAPDDLLTIDVDALFPELKGERVRGRRVDGHVVPYYTRAEIETGIDSLRGREILWVDDPVELFFLHIQGSGRVELDNGEIVRVGYANHNGHPYRSVGRILIDRGELTIANASMQGIKQWGRKHPDQLQAVLAENPAYVFFRELPSNDDGPIGALGVPITPGRSIAVDEQSVPLGVPVYLVTSWPNSNRPLSRLVFAQDKGSAIKGAVRADFFWGYGDDAGQLAGRMRQSGEMWVLLPATIQTSANRYPGNRKK
ncbi:MAG: murein transglycosylase A [Burkholderiales bacterium]